MQGKQARTCAHVSVQLYTRCQMACGNGDTLYKTSKQGRTSKADYACCDKSTNEEQQLVRVPAAAAPVSCICNSGKDDLSSHTE